VTGWESGHQSSCNPFRVGIERHAEMADFTIVMVNDEETVQLSEKDRGYDEEIHGGNGVPMVAEEDQPIAFFREFPLGHIAGNGSLGDAIPEFAHLAVDARRAPSQVVQGHLPDKMAYLSASCRIVSTPSFFGYKTPIQAKSFSMPFHDCFWFND